MRCRNCGLFYLPSDTRCERCGAALAPVKGEVLSNTRSKVHHYWLSSGGYLWEYRDLQVPLDLVFVPPGRSDVAHRAFVEQFDRAMTSALNEAAADGWEPDAPVTWEDLCWAGAIEQPWWDRVRDTLGIGGARRFKAAVVRLRRVADRPAAAS